MSNILGLRLKIVVGLATLLSCAAHAAADIPQEKYDAQVTGYTDPAYVDHRFTSIVVYAPDVPLDTRPMVEAAAVEKLRNIGVRAQRGIDIIPPTRDDNETERNLLLKQSGADATLYLTTENLSTEVIQKKLKIIPSVTPKKLDPETGTFVANPNPNPPLVKGGEITQIPIGSFSARLLDNITGNVAWKSSIAARGEYDLVDNA